MRSTVMPWGVDCVRGQGPIVRGLRHLSNAIPHDREVGRHAHGEIGIAQRARDLMAEGLIADLEDSRPGPSKPLP
jgi:hypothetical protein